MPKDGSKFNVPSSLNMIFGGMAGMIVGLCLQPLEIVKNNIIINPHNIS